MAPLPVVLPPSVVVAAVRAQGTRTDARVPEVPTRTGPVKGVLRRDLGPWRRPPRARTVAAMRPQPPTPTTRRHRLTDRLAAAHRRWAVREPAAHVRGRVLELSGREVDVTLDHVGVLHLEQHRPAAVGRGHHRT